MTVTRLTWHLSVPLELSNSELLKYTGDLENFFSLVCSWIVTVKFQ